MKTVYKPGHFYFLITAALLIITASSCNKQLDSIKPYNQVSAETQLSYKAGLLEATQGNYQQFYTQTDPTGGALFQYFYYWHNLAEFRGNNVVITTPVNSNGNVVSGNDAYLFLNSAQSTSGLSYPLWRKSYVIIAGCNAVLSAIDPQTTDPDLLTAIGTNLFLRAYCHFNLLQLYGRPYYQSPQTNLGIVLSSTSTGQQQKRATVDSSYNFILNDLKQAAAYLPALASYPAAANKTYATKEAAWAFLSRVYLYMGGTGSAPNGPNNVQAVLYADSVINSGNFQLATTSQLPQLFNTADATGVNEFIFAFNGSTPNSNQTLGYYSPGFAPFGFAPGGVNASPDYLQLLAPADVRSSFITNGNFVSKWSYQALNYFFLFTHQPIVQFRLSEMYLNRAEAEAKNGMDQAALTDLNTIHTRAGLQAYSGLSSQDLLTDILQERRLELAFEGQASFDNFRNGLPMVRSYSSYNTGPLTIQPTDNRVVMQIPAFEIQENPLLIQNPQ